MDNMDDPSQGADICRVCRSEGMPERPLFHPCICTGSIKYIHQECLVQWMHYSRKEYCELCSYQFSFTPIYAPDMPRRLPIKDVAAGVTSSVLTGIKYWLHFTLVGLAWLCVVPFTACRIYRSLFNGSFDAVISLPLDMWSSKNISGDIFHGCFVVTCTLFAFIGLIWLREQILHGGGPDWLERDEPNNQQQQLNVLLPPIPEDNPAEEADGEVRQENGNQVDEGHWNPIDWGDRAAEDLTWERLLGLDGSLVFLEHVFWVVSMNALFILVFAFCPYQMGNLAISAMSLQEKVAASHFEGLVTTLCGYCLIGMCLLMMHTIATIIGFRRSKRILGLSYIVVKVSLLSVVEIGVLPLVCGWWLDICSLSMFDASFKDRLTSFRMAPGTSMFIHWLVGMVYVYYFASFVLLLREIVRPGVLWFLRNLNDPDFSPIQELIQQGMFQHGRRLIASAMIFGTAVFLVIWLPIRILKFIWPSFLPYNVTLHSDSVNELSMELLLLQVILPALLEQTHTRNWLRLGIYFWCFAVSYCLGLTSYLIGDRREPQPDVPPIHPPAADLGAAHEGLLRRGGPVGFRPYSRPDNFVLRLIVLLIVMAISVVFISLSIITIPVWLGRLAMSFWPSLLPTTSEPSQAPNIHELYTAACGTYICWLSVRAYFFVAGWMPEGRTVVLNRLKFWIKVGLKAIVAFIVLLGIIPFLFGLLLELVMVVPFRVPLHHTPVLWAWQDWALGVLYMKIACAITLMGPDWKLRRAIERTYRDGFMRLDLNVMMNDLAIPVISVLSLFLAIPYVIAYSLVPIGINNKMLRLLIARRIYPTLMASIIITKGLLMQVRQFKRLYEHIKNDKYLVGRRLVNYNHTTPVTGRN
ncbi:Zinc finger, RING-CH-type,Zinc finger, RING/FYVE/PHD-type [Cinara cedri]|uniref:E3 ubiquitin-protein ligase MARCHF6 n=1 Tax=Cinara cedri TaxID=506608 RepID=A0A5E4N1H9_9HEMI|nr:Zinc finger, RING-CH-type,Zinc finger, RING/FYVE/PHD-type [Cinara cedri]